MSAIDRFVSKAAAVKAAAEDDYDEGGAVIVNFLESVEATGGSPAERLAKLQPLIDLVKGVDASDPAATIGHYSGSNADEVNMTATEAATHLSGLSRAEARARQVQAVAVLRGDLEVTNGNELKAVVDARAAIDEARRQIADANAAKTAAEARVSQLEAILQRAKSAISKPPVGGEVIKDRALIEEIKAL